MIHPDTTHYLESLKNNLRQLPAQRQQNLGILIGPMNSGKTAFLDQSELTANLTSFDNDNECNSWYDDNATFVEIPEFVQKDKTVLKQALKIIYKITKKKHLDMIVACFNVYDCMKESPRQLVNYLKLFQQTAEYIAKHSKVAPWISIVFTHMDKIAGFCHSFDDSTEVWGYELQPYPNVESLIKQNSQKYSELLSELHTSLIPKLHHTQDNLSRYLIREFPLQMESLSNMIKACVKHMHCDNAKVSGVFFVSASQGNTAHDRLSANINRSYELTVKDMVPQGSRDQVFFIKGAIDKIIRKKVSIVPKSVEPRVIVATVAGISLSLGIFIHYLQNHRLLDKANKEISVFKNLSHNGPSTLLPALSHMANAEAALNQLQGVLPLKELNRYKKNIKTLYKNNLAVNFLPLMARLIEIELNKKQNITDTYYALKAYVMLGNPKYTNNHYLMNWLNALWKKNQFKHRDIFKKLLVAALKKPYLGTELNKSVLDNARSFLKAIPNNYLFYALIEKSFPKTNEKLKLDNFILGQHAIPYQYQKNNFNDIYQQHLVKLSQSLSQESYVLDRIEKNLQHTLQETYLINYVNWWQKFSDNTSPMGFNNYRQGVDIFSGLASHDSSLKKLVNLIQYNTSAIDRPNSESDMAFNKIVASHFASFNLFTNRQIESLTPIFKDLTHYLTILNTASDNNETAFKIAKARFNKRTSDPISQLYELDNELPKPLSIWIKNLGDNAWTLVLAKTQSYINEQWQEKVYRQYVRDIKDRFPFNRNAKEEISLVKFTRFFKQEGVLTEFFNQYLSPFIDTSTAKWHTKKLDGLRLPVNDKTITELIRANVIKKMFFKQNVEQPTANFSLHLIALEPIIKTLKLSIAGQELLESQSRKNSLEFVWPGDNDKLTMVSVENISGERFNLSETGDWSWFRILSNANLKAYDNDTRNYQLILDINGNAAKFLLTTTERLNPFIPHILENFKLPEELA